MKKRKLYNIAFMGDKDHGCDIISTLESWGGSNYYSRTGNDIEYAYFINDLGTIDFIHNSAFLSEGMKNFYFLFWHDYNIECHLKVGESINYGGQYYDVDSILFDANNRCIVYKLKSFGIGVEYITNNELTPTEEYQTEEVNNMKTKLAIQGHPTRGNEVIKLLEMMGGTNPFSNGMVIGNKATNCYYISENTVTKYISWDYIGPEEINEYKIFTLEEFLEKYPFNVGDKVFDTADGDPGIITAMKWDENVSDMNYHIVFDNGDMGWYTNDMIEFLKEDNKEMNGNIETNHSKVNGLKRGDEYPIMEGVECNECIKYYFPEGYEFVDTDDTGVYLKPIKSKYPKTYKECCDVLGVTVENLSNFIFKDFCLTVTHTFSNSNEYYINLFKNFFELKLCYDAYRKIVGEQMGLGKPWEPDWSTENERKYVIEVYRNNVRKNSQGYSNTLLAFPTEEMRDTFYKNFKDLIEECKELL